MCGIAGIISPAGSRPEAQAVARMVSAQRHRGPDDQGTLAWTSPAASIALGHRRLAILDLSRDGRQPFTNRETGDVVVFNGEIYNFHELRRELQSLGSRFSTECDTEVLLHAYQHWGIGCLDRFRGMFAFGLWDAARNHLLLARDHVGIKPLYYAECAGGSLVFASETQAIAASGLVDSGIDQQGVASFLSYGAVQDPLTIHRNIRSLPAGHFLTYTPGNAATIKRYWSFPEPDHSRSAMPDAAIAEDLRAMLESSLDRHLVSDVPVGVFLSGGLDSTVLAALAARQNPGCIRTFTVSFPDAGQWDEAPIAAQTASRCGAEHLAVKIDRQSAMEGVGQYLQAMDQPTIDGLNTFLVSRAARENGIAVALSGLGADELFGGYPSFTEVPHACGLLQRMRNTPKFIRTSGARYASLFRDRAYRTKLTSLMAADPTIENAYAIRRQLFSASEIGGFGLPFINPNCDPDSIVSGDAIATVSRLEARHYMGNMLLRDSDVFSMRSSLELRVPFLDRDLVEWTMSLPGPTLLPSGSVPKYRLEAAIKDWLPAAAARPRAPKRGFVVPLLKWSHGRNDDLLREGCEAAAKVVSIDATPLFNDFRRFPIMRTWSRLWSVAVLGQWLLHAKSSREEMPDEILLAGSQR